MALIPYLSCFECDACRSGKTNCCENISVMGVHQDGGFSDYLCVPAANLLVVDDLAPEAAALIEPFAISAHAVRRAAVAQGEQVLVVGAGPIGLGLPPLPLLTARRWWSRIPVITAVSTSVSSWASVHSIRLMRRL